MVTVRLPVTFPAHQLHIHLSAFAGCDLSIMYYLSHLVLFALTVSARCTRREAASEAQQQSPGKLALLPASNNSATSPILNNGGEGASPPTSTTPTGTTNSSSSGAAGCPPLMKAVAFNGGMNAGMFDTIGAAQDWLTFSPNIPGPPASPHAAAGFVPTMAFRTRRVHGHRPDQRAQPSSMDAHLQ